MGVGKPAPCLIMAAGRRTKLTQEVIDDFCGAISIGCTYDAACVNAEIGYSTYRSWAVEGEKAREKQEAGEKLDRKEARFLDFLEAIDEAKATAKLQWQSTIDKAARLDPAWAWRMLQVRAPADYNPPQKAEVSGANGGPIVINMTWGDGDDGDPA